MKVILTGDWHVGAETVNVEEILRVKEKYWKGKPVILMGDLLDAGLDRGMQFSQKLNPDTQIEAVKEILNGLDVRTALIGNHEIRFFKNAGINIYKLLGYPQNHDLEIDGCSFYVTHGRSAAANTLTEFTKLFKFVDTDIIAIGHDHDLMVYNVIRGTKRVVLCRTGSFLSGAVYALQNAHAPKIKGWIEVDTRKHTAQCYGIIKGRVMKI